MTLNLLHPDIQSIYSHGQEFKLYLSSLDIQPDVICVQESFLKPHINFSLSGYGVFRADRPLRAGGGLITFVRDGLSCTELSLPGFESIECQCYKIAVHNGQSINVIIFYNPCNKINPSDLDLLMRSMERSCILCGDCNAHNELWGSNSTDINGNTLAQFVDDNNLVLLNDGTGTRLDIRTGKSSALE